MFRRPSTLPPPLPPETEHFVIYHFTVFVVFCVVPKAKTKNTSFRDVKLNYNHIYFKFC